MGKPRNPADTAKKVDVAKKLEETVFFIEPMTNSYSGERQIQINDTYVKDGELQYGRRGINISVVDMPAVVQAIGRWVIAGKNLLEEVRIDIIEEGC